MAVMSIRVEDEKRKLLKVIASLEEKTISSLVGELIDDYLRKKKKSLKNSLEQEELIAIMKLSESSFAEWDNEEDAVYDSL